MPSLLPREEPGLPPHEAPGGALTARDLAPRDLVVLPPSLPAHKALAALTEANADLALVGPPAGGCARVATTESLARAVAGGVHTAYKPLRHFTLDVPCASDAVPLHELEALMESSGAPCMLLCGAGGRPSRLFGREEIAEIFRELLAASERALAALMGASGG
jgi:hypothetical protein